jgi:crossover junction endodeoxyribonuclease RuvC
MAVETIFYSRSARSALIMGHVRGVVLLVAAKAGLEVFEYTPLEIKLSVVGSGAASKRQVQFMVSKMLSVSGRLPIDASDALAVALCHVNKCAREHYDRASRVGGVWTQAALNAKAVKSVKGIKGAPAVKGAPGVKGAS